VHAQDAATQCSKPHQAPVAIKTRHTKMNKIRYSKPESPKRRTAPKTTQCLHFKRTTYREELRTSVQPHTFIAHVTFSYLSPIITLLKLHKISYGSTKKSQSITFYKATTLSLTHKAKIASSLHKANPKSPKGGDTCPLFTKKFSHVRSR
jgi:hypothetical protein